MAVTRKLQRTKKDQYTVTIPKTLVELLGLKEQDKLEFSLEEGKIILKKAPASPKKGSAKKRGGHA